MTNVPTAGPDENGKGVDPTVPPCPAWCDTRHGDYCDDVGRERDGRPYVYRYHETILDIPNPADGTDSEDVPNTMAVILCVTDDLLAGRRRGPRVSVDGGERMTPTLAVRLSEVICYAVALLEDTK